MSRVIDGIRTLLLKRSRFRTAPASFRAPISEDGDLRLCHVTHELFRPFGMFLESSTTDSGALEYLKGNYFNNYLVWLLTRFQQPGDRVLDLGANVGTFSLAAAAAGFQVLAVEASPKHVELLRRSKQHNGFGDLQVVHAAASDRPGVLRFHPAEQWGMVAHPQMAEPTIEVPAMRVDDLLEQVGWDQVHFIKIDIEGSEIAALRGMTTLLSRETSPVIVYESNGLSLSWFGYSVGDLWKLLAGHGFRVFQPSGERFQLCSTPYFQPEASLDLIALKPQHERGVASRIDGPPSEEEMVERIVREAKHAHPYQRGYIAQALSQASPEVLANPTVRRMLDLLLHDPAESVRVAAHWWASRNR